MKKNVFLLTWYYSINYGTCIQCYALAQYLRNNSFNVYIPSTNRYYYGIKHPIETIYNIADKIEKNILTKETKINNNYSELFHNREKKNSEFAYNQTKVTKIESRKEYKDIISKCDYFISGSDQIWNPRYVKPPMLLSMAPKNKTKIAYGSSIGVSQIPKNMIKMYKKYINRFNYIGVREKTAQKLIKDILNIDTEIVLDPSFLLNKNEWEKIAIKPKNIKEDEEFIFGYFIGDIRKNENEIYEFAQDNKLPVYYAMSESKINYSYGTTIVDMGIEEFIWCLLHAKYIITDSFHAVALSINFNKNFYVYKRFNDMDKKSQNSRILDIIKTFNLNENMESEKTNLNNIKNKINFEKINQILDLMKRHSIGFLNKALGEKYDE